MKLILLLSTLLLMACVHTYRASPSLLLPGPGYAEDLIKNVTEADTVWLHSVNKKWAVFKWR